VATHFPGATLSVSEALTGGVSAEVNRLNLVMPDGTNRSVVLREHGATHDGNELAVEFATLQALHSAGLAVPEPLACDGSRRLLEHPWLLMSFVEGSADIPGHDVDNRVDAMADHMIGLHETSFSSLPPLPMTVDPLPNLLEWMGDGSEWQALRESLQGFGPAAYTGDPVLLHGDFWPGNIIWSDSGTICAVLDWEDASLGDPLFDVACTGLELRYIYGKDGMERFCSAYAEHHPIDTARLALWQAYAGIWSINNMGNWRLEPEREDKMRSEAVNTIREASHTIAR